MAAMLLLILLPIFSSTSADNMMTTNRAIMDAHDEIIQNLVTTMEQYLGNLSAISDQMNEDYSANMEQQTIDMRTGLFDRISESHQAGEFEVKDSLFPLRQPYTRMRDTLRAINRGIPMRTNNIVSSNLPYFETFMENLPTMADVAEPPAQEMTLSSFLRNNPAGLTSDEICGTG